MQSEPHDDEVLAYWNRPDVESMYDKHLLAAEIALIRQRIPRDSKILDAGCGEGEGTVIYAEVPGAVVDAADFSETRLKLAAERLTGRPNVRLLQVDFLKPHAGLDSDYDVIVSQRFLINIMDWERQKEVLLALARRLKPSGRLVMLEGSQDGVDSLNALRAALGLEPIPVRWHNRFFNDRQLIDLMEASGYKLLEEDGLGTYFMLTRGVRPTLDKRLNWDCSFNKLAAKPQVRELLGFTTQFSRLRLWVFGQHTPP